MRRKHCLGGQWSSVMVTGEWCRGQWWALGSSLQDVRSARLWAVTLSLVTVCGCDKWRSRSRHDVLTRLVNNPRPISDKHKHQEALSLTQSNTDTLIYTCVFFAQFMGRLFYFMLLFVHCPLMTIWKATKALSGRPVAPWKRGGVVGWRRCGRGNNDGRVIRGQLWQNLASTDDF